MRDTAWILLGMALAVLIGSATGYAAHWAELEIECSQVWDVQDAPQCAGRD